MTRDYPEGMDYIRLGDLRSAIIDAVRDKDAIGGIKAFDAYDLFILNLVPARFDGSGESRETKTGTTTEPTAALRTALDEAINVTAGPGNGTWTRSRPIEEWRRLDRLFRDARAGLASQADDRPAMTDDCPDMCPRWPGCGHAVADFDGSQADDPSDAERDAFQNGYREGYQAGRLLESHRQADDPRDGNWWIAKMADEWDDERDIEWHKKSRKIY